MRRITGVIAVGALLTVGTASASSLGIGGTTTLAADSIELSGCTATGVELVADYAEALAPTVDEDAQIPLGSITGDFTCEAAGPHVVDIIVWDASGVASAPIAADWSGSGPIVLPAGAVPDIQDVDAVDIVVRDGGSTSLLKLEVPR